MFKDSEEGSVPRKKIRIRSYSRNQHKDENSNLEIKISSVEGRYKTTNKISNLQKVFSAGYFNNDYGVCKPKVRITYERSYYKINGIRLTIDQNIEYKAITKNSVVAQKYIDPEIAVELKADDQVAIEFLNRSFPFDRVRFSKYSRAINTLLTRNFFVR